MIGAPTFSLSTSAFWWKSTLAVPWCSMTTLPISRPSTCVKTTMVKPSGLDVLFPGIGEIVGGSQREERLDILQEKMKQFDIPEESMWWYLETRKYGSCKHSGFGLGFERLVQFVTGMTNIQDVIPFPRTPGSAEFLTYAQTETQPKTQSKAQPSANPADEAHPAADNRIGRANTRRIGDQPCAGRSWGAKIEKIRTNPQMS